VASEVTQATGRAERDSAQLIALVLKGAHQKTLGADKGYDTLNFVADLPISGITPHVAQNIQTRPFSAIDGRNARHQGYGKSINTRKRIE
jgi:IS5 family transposase